MVVSEPRDICCQNSADIPILSGLSVALLARQKLRCSERNIGHTCWLLLCLIPACMSSTGARVSAMETNLFSLTTLALACPQRSRSASSSMVLYFRASFDYLCIRKTGCFRTGKGFSITMAVRHGKRAFTGHAPLGLSTEIVSRQFPIIQVL